MKLNYRVCFEESVGDMKHYVPIYGGFDSPFLWRAEDKKQVEWTQEREKFFKKLYNSLSEAAVRAHEFLEEGGDKTQLIDDAIARGAGNLLIGPEEKHGK